MKHGAIAHRFIRWVLIAICVCALTILLGGCDEADEPTSEVTSRVEAPAQGSQDVSITIECDENLFFSRYDLDVYIDDEYQGSLDHGTTKEFVMGLDEGAHHLRVTEKEDDSVDGNIDFTVSGSTTLKYQAKCTNQQVEIEAVDAKNPPISSKEVSSYYHDEIHRAFEDAGFTNIREVEQRDLSVAQRKNNWHAETVSIAGDEDFTSDDFYFSDDEVIITYHMSLPI